MAVKLKLEIPIFFMFVLLHSFRIAHSKHVFDVTKLGLKSGNGVPDITQALATAWKQACASPRASKVLIPKGTYKLKEIFLMGPCNSPMHLQLDGVLLAPKDPKKFQSKGSWVTFKRIDGFQFSGHGVLDGQGATAWSHCIKSSCSHLPVNVRFAKITNGVVRGITSLNSKHFHACINGCHNFTVRNVSIQAPAESPNTDGIHISQSSDVTVTHSAIATGDDCIAMIHGDQRVNITGVTCGPGHGISVGSLGKYKHEGPVDGITVKHCRFNGTDNGLRVKTWPNQRRGSASNIVFEDISMTNVTNPIIIDQTYCGKGKCTTKKSSAIKIKDIKFRRIRGTSATQEAVKLMCSKATPCEGVEMSDIDLKYVGKTGKATSRCSNVNPKCSGKLQPPICTATADGKPQGVSAAFGVQLSDFNAEITLTT